MSCSSCKFLKENNKREGCVSGACYFCSKNNCYVNGANNKCSQFQKSYRSNYICDKIFEDGEIYYDNSKGNGFYLIILIIMLLMCILFN